MKGFFSSLLAAALALSLGCRREPPPAPPEQPSLAAAAASAPAETNDFAALLPRVGGPEGYVGSQDCRSCHEDQFNSWHQSYHRTMTQFPSAEAVQADFNHVVLTNGGVRFRLSQKTNEFWVRMERIVPEDFGAPPPAMDTRISLITGSHHMQVFWVPGDDPNTQIGFPFTWLIPEKKWVPRHSTFIRPPDMAHRAEIWNVTCSRCHSTAPEPRVDPAARLMDTRVAELGISCEACHGPGQRHVQARQADLAKAITPSAEAIRNEILHPKEIDAARSAQICGFCHSMKWIDSSEPWHQDGFRYRPGDDLERTTPIIAPSRVKDIPGLAKYLGQNPDILRDFFWPDGMVRVSGREYNGLIDSPCHKGGKFSCVSCHSSHSSEPNDQLARNRAGNGACIQCHEEYRDETRLTAHTRHLAGSSGSECYNCHMPHTTYGVLKAIRSHQVSSPRLADDLASGRPNACNLCHLDKTLAWTGAKLTEWHGQPAPALSPHHTNTAESVRLALSGDAGQRALLAWHFSWPPALQASGTNWVPSVLGQLLDDPYAAVRCVADRSLRDIAPGLRPAGYDYAAEADSRPPARDQVWRAWSARESNAQFSEATLAQPGALENQHRVFEVWRQRRDDRAVRLRE